MLPIGPSSPHTYQARLEQVKARRGHPSAHINLTRRRTKSGGLKKKRKSKKKVRFSDQVTPRKKTRSPRRS